ncbi:hypothetical protein QQ045_001110 [Rhodiola kirilowii]
MGKQGPCCHCGVPSTPLWRNGPPDKPVLCNACGSRWRTKGSLTNYTPLHSRAEPDNSMDYRASRIKIISGRVEEANFLKRKRTYENVTTGNIISDYNDTLWKAMDDDTSNRSSSGSVVSNSESNAQFDVTCVNGLTGFSQYIAVNTDRMKPAKKRTPISRPTSSSIAMLTKDVLFCISNSLLAFTDHQKKIYFLSATNHFFLLKLVTEVTLSGIPAP